MIGELFICKKPVAMQLTSAVEVYKYNKPALAIKLAWLGRGYYIKKLAALRGPFELLLSENLL